MAIGSLFIGSFIGLASAIVAWVLGAGLLVALALYIGISIFAGAIILGAAMANPTPATPRPQPST